MKIAISNAQKAWLRRHRTIKKSLFAMQLTGFFILAVCLNVSAHGMGQGITLTVKNASLQKVFSEVIQQSGTTILYDVKLIRTAKPVTVQVKNASVEEVLQLVLAGQPFKYEKSGNLIIVKPAEKVPEIPRPAFEGEAPPITVRGKIVNENGEPVAASIIIKGTTRGVTSDANGNFRLDNVDDNAVLIITATNIETTSIALKGNTTLVITVNSAVASLSEVVVNKGYYSESKRLSTGNVARVDAKDIDKQNITNPLSALQGRVAGVYIQQQTGLPGGGMDLKIRGTNSLRFEGNYPLYIIDGVPFVSEPIVDGTVANQVVNLSNPLNNISPSNIEKIEILKDADATAIYGSRGANGVVLITTRRSREGMNISLNFNKGVGKLARKIDMLNTSQYLEMRNEAIRNDDLLTYFQNPQFDIFWPDLKIWDSTRYTDWQKELLGGTAQYTNAQVGLSGGNEKTKFSIGGNFYKETTVFPGSFNFQRASGYVNINHLALKDKLNLSLNASYTTGNNQLPNQDYYKDALSLAPNTPKPFNEDGTLNFENLTFKNNPYALLKNKYKALTTNLISNINLRYEVVKNLFIKSNFGLNTLRSDEAQLRPIAALTPDVAYMGGGNLTANSQVKTWIVEPQMEYSHLIGNGKLSALAGFTFQNTSREARQFEATGFTSDALIENLLAAPNFYLRSNNSTDYRYNAFFARLNYNLQNKYVVNITGRRDGSSRFGPEKQFANFGAIGCAWIFSEENYFRNNFKFLSLGKIRGSFGTTGSDQISDYMYLNSYASVNDPYNGVSAFIPARLANLDYSWETNKKLEFGTELGVLNNNILLSISYYRNRSSNQLVGYPLSAVTGQRVIQYNFPATVQNSGTEITLSAKVIKNQPWSWSTDFNITIPKSKLISFPEIDKFDYYSRRYTVGEPITVQRFQHFMGVDAQTGTYIFQDLNNNGSDVDFPDDYNFLRNVAQKYFGGWSNSMHCKGLTLDFTFQFVKQTGFGLRYNYGDAPGSLANQPVEVMNRWQKPGDIAVYQLYTTNLIGGTAAQRNFLFTQSDASVVDASFIRLKNISLSWNLPSSIVSRFNFGGIRIYAQAQNLITITNYSGNDPEMQSTKLPLLRVITCGIDISF